MDLNIYFFCVEELKEEPAELLYRGPLIQGNSNLRKGKKK